jgi:hypothetical protein
MKFQPTGQMKSSGLLTCKGVFLADGADDSRWDGRIFGEDEVANHAA